MMLKKRKIKSFLKDLTNTNIVLYGYGTIGKAIELYLTKYRKDLKIVHIIDSYIPNEATLQPNIKTISFGQLLENKDQNFQIIICNDNDGVIRDIKKNLTAEKFNFLEETISRKDVQYTIFRKTSFLATPFLPFLMIKETSISIWNIIVALLQNEWQYLSGNTKRIAFNNLYYYIQDYNIQKFGRYGESHLLSGGNYSLKNLFHTTPFSLRVQASFGTTFMMFFAMCFWMFSWVILYEDNSQLPVILFFSIFSTLFFAVFIEQQNYNILGWMLFPIFLTSLISSSYTVLTVILFLISLFSFTGFFISAILVLVSISYTLDFYSLLVLIPGTIKVIIPIIFAFINTDAIRNIAGGIGMYNKVKYSRKKYKSINIRKSYILGLLLQFSLLYAYLSNFNHISLLVLTISALFIINELMVRVADQQSFYIAYLSVSIFALLNIEYNIYLYISYLFSIYPMYGYILNMRCTGNSFITPGVKKPFNVKETIDGLNNLYKGIPEGSKLFVTYKNPQGDYGKIFNGYRWFNEPIQYIATINRISLFPDWYMVFENNTQNSPEDFWVDSIDEIINYMKKENIKYTIVPHFLYEEQMLENFKLLGQYKLDYQDGNIKSEFKLYVMELVC